MKIEKMPLDVLLSHHGVREFHVWDDKSLIWLEDQDGVGCLKYSNDDVVERIISLDYSVKSGLLYGGGEFTVRDSKVVFCANRNQLVMWDKNTNTLTPITPMWGRVAAPSISPDAKWVLFVFSDGENDLIDVVPMHGMDWPRQLIKGADFYLQAVWHPGGEYIAWVEWDHPLMPWQGSRVKIGEVGGMQLRLFSENWIAGRKGNAAHQPQFSPNGRWLSYLEQNDNWENLILYDLKKKTKRTLVHGADFMLSTPDWVQGLHSYIWDHESRFIYYIRYADAQATLWQVNVRGGKSTCVEFESYTWLSQISMPSTGNSPTMLVSSPSIPKKMAVLHHGKLQILGDGRGELSAFIPDPYQIHWKGLDGDDVFGILYLPMDSSQSHLPLLIDVHGGPTMQRSFTYMPEAGFFASRGFAYLQVNYRGSSGFGKCYRDRLQGKWGEIEVDDIYSAAEHLIKREIADKERIAVLGNSSGGTTVLNVLRKYPGVFCCGVCSYAIGDLILDAKQTHKFERFYHRYLIGDPVQDYNLFEERSPLFHVDEIQDPLMLFHGSDDRVVMPTQSQQLYDSLKKRNIPCILTIFDGEGHGFKGEENLREYYRMVLDFLAEYMRMKCSIV